MVGSAEINDLFLPFAEDRETHHCCAEYLKPCSIISLYLTLFKIGSKMFTDLWLETCTMKLLFRSVALGLIQYKLLGRQRYIFLYLGNFKDHFPNL